MRYYISHQGRHMWTVFAIDRKGDWHTGNTYTSRAAAREAVSYAKAAWGF